LEHLIGRGQLTLAESNNVAKSDRQFCFNDLFPRQKKTGVGDVK
jgi:hypothetical protein